MQRPSLRKQRFATKLRHWRSALPGTLDDFLAQRSRRRRETVRRYSRRLEKTYGDDARVEIVRDCAGLEKLFAESKLIHQETYQHVLGVGFSDENVQRRLAELAADRGWFRGYMLYLRDKPVAFWHGNAYRGSFGVALDGIRSRLRRRQAGDVPAHAGRRGPLGDGSAQALDFGFGDADYKRHFGDGFVEEQDVGVFERRTSTIALNAVHSTLGGATAAGRTVAGSTGALTNIRRRRRLGQHAGPPANLRRPSAPHARDRGRRPGSRRGRGPPWGRTRRSRASSSSTASAVRRSRSRNERPELAGREPEGRGRAEPR